MSDVLLIPSAILVPDELRLNLGRIPTGMIPLSGRPMLEHVVDAYDDPDVYIACDEEQEQIKSYIQREGKNWTPIEVSGSRSLGDTVYRSLTHIEQSRGFDVDDVFRLNFADTLVEPTHESDDSDVISYDFVTNPVRWTSFELKDDGKLGEVTAKLDPAAAGRRRVFTGVFSFSEPSAFRDCLREQNDSPPHAPALFYGALKQYLQERQCEFCEAEEWIDVGHLDSYHRVKRNFMTVREFNDVGVKDDENVVRKTSDRIDTLTAEYNWYTSVPQSVTPYVPRVYDFSADEGYLDIEYIGYPSLSDIHLYGSHGLHIWKSIFESLFNVLEIFRESKETTAIDESLHQMYVEKTERRLNDVDRDGPLDEFFRERVVVNGVEYAGVPVILERLEDVLRRTGVLDIDEFNIIHGDPCFSNVMHDIRTGVVKLIDPRGAFGEHTIYGDQRYDCAKILHSIVGHYDFIINDRFEVNRTSDGISYEVYLDDRHYERQKLACALFEQRFPETYASMEVIESLLFLSMVPLHDDRPDRQQYMLGRGVERFNYWMNNECEQ